MAFRLIPREEKFYTDFQALATELIRGARLLEEMLDPDHPIWDKADEIKEVEHKCDFLTHDIIQRLNRTFVTPIDREDIHMLASRLDDVVDLIDGTSRRFEMLHITEVHRPAKQLTNILCRAGSEIQVAVTEMRKPPLVNEHVALIKHLEEEGDAVYHEAVGALFSGKPDPLEVIKWKEIYDTLERAIDSCMAVAQVLQSISLKNA